MPHTNVDLAIWYHEEDAYGAGFHATPGAEYSKTQPAADNFTRVNLLAGDVKMKGRTYKRKRLTPPGLTLGAGKVITTGSEFPDLEFSYYLQTAADPFKAVAVGGTRGSAGTSYVFQVKVPDPDESGSTLIYNVFGAQMISYKSSGSMDGEKPPLITVRFKAFAIELNTGTAQTGALPAGVINEWDDITVTLDSDAIVELSSYELTIEFKYWEPGSGKNGTFDKIKPLITDKTFKFEPKFFKDSAAIMQDTITETLNSFVSNWTDGTNTINVTNTYVESDNFMELTGDLVDGVEYNATIVGGDSVYS